MAPKRGIKRKDKSRVVLKKGESQRKDGTYDYRWTSRNGRRHSNREAFGFKQQRQISESS